MSRIETLPNTEPHLAYPTKTLAVRLDLGPGGPLVGCSLDFPQMRQRLNSPHHPKLAMISAGWLVLAWTGLACTLSAGPLGCRACSSRIHHDGLFQDLHFSQKGHGLGSSSRNEQHSYLFESRRPHPLLDNMTSSES